MLLWKNKQNFSAYFHSILSNKPQRADNASKIIATISIITPLPNIALCQFSFIDSCIRF